MRNKAILYLVQAAIIAALYAALALIFAPISYGLVQVRISEALTILPMFTPAAVPGLLIGCLLANLVGGLGIYDIVFGSLATLLAAFLSYKLRRHRFLVPLPPTIVNAIVVGAMLTYVFNVGAPLWMSMLYVGAGQLVACYALGIPLSIALSKVSTKLFGTEAQPHKK